MNRRQDMFVLLITGILFAIFSGIGIAWLGRSPNYQLVDELVIGLFSLNLLLALFMPKLRRFLAKS